jgi:hypothetical protein
MCFSDMPIVSDVELNEALSDYEEHSFDKIPQWIRKELRLRNLPEFIRKPTQVEMQDTMSDARIHRITHNEKTIEDFQDKYKLGIPFTQLT